MNLEDFRNKVETTKSRILNNSTYRIPVNSMIRTAKINELQKRTQEEIIR